jgi:hypothetical protein
MTSSYKNEHHLGMTKTTSVTLNERNARFWAEQKILLNQRISDPGLYHLAKRDMDFEVARGVPLKQQKTLEQALADAAYSKATFHSQLSLKGGRAPKSDSLQELIQKFVHEDPKISQRQLWYKLRTEIGKGIIVSIDAECPSEDGSLRKIHFMSGDGKVKTARVSGLKNRLSRAKAKLHSL